jgi:hypothetical protein
MVLEGLRNSEKASFLLSAWDHSLSSHPKVGGMAKKSQFANRFAPGGSILAATTVNNKKYQAEFSRDTLLKQDLSQNYTTMEKIYCLKLQMSFQGGTAIVASDQLATLDGILEKVAVYSKATAEWNFGSYENKLAANTLKIEQTDQIGKSNLCSDFTELDIKTRYWQDTVRPSETVDTSRLNGQKLHSDGLKPQDVQTVLRYWSNYFKSGEKLAREALGENTFLSEVNGEEKKISPNDTLCSVTLSIFKNELGEIWATFTQNVTNCENKTFSIQGKQRWSIAAHNRQQISKEIALHIRKKEGSELEASITPVVQFGAIQPSQPLPQNNVSMMQAAAYYLSAGFYNPYSTSAS